MYTFYEYEDEDRKSEKERGKVREKIWSIVRRSSWPRMGKKKNRCEINNYNKM